MSLIEWIYLIVGMLFISAVSIFAIASFIAWICNSIRVAKENRFEAWARHVCNDIDRWCDYEFPQVGFTMRELSKCISSGWSCDSGNFREKLRRGEWKHEPSGSSAQPEREI